MTDREYQSSVCSSAGSTSGTTATTFSGDFEHEVNKELAAVTTGSSSSPLLFRPSSPSAPGYAPESLLTRGLQVPSKSSDPSSGFAYPEVLAGYGISGDQWRAFTRELAALSKLSGAQWASTVGKSLGAAAVGALMVGFLSPIAAAVVGSKMAHRHEKRNLLAARDTGRLAEMVARWNDAVFRPAGLLVRVDVPGDSDGMAAMDLQSVDGASTSSSLGSAHSSMDEERYSDDVVKEGRERRKAARKGRIVIIPLNEQTLDEQTLPSEQSPERASGSATNN